MGTNIKNFLGSLSACCIFTSCFLLSIRRSVCLSLLDYGEVFRGSKNSGWYRNILELSRTHLIQPLMEDL